MKKIGLISDTHGTIIPQLFDFFKDVDEIWHAGDIGNIATADTLAAFKPLIAVHGNIDDHLVRMQYKESLFFQAEELSVYMTHVGGYPGHYMPEIKRVLEKAQPDIFVCGHSHILRVISDDKLNLLHLNPGAAGKSGFHKKITMLRFAIDKKQIKDMEIFELDRKGVI